MMGKTSTVFFNSRKTLEETAQEISGILRVPLKRHHEEESSITRYEGLGMFVHIVLYDKHDMENDRDMHFENYAYLLDFADQYREAQGSDLLRQSAAMVTYQIITNVLKYQAMLVEDMQRLVEQSHRQAASSGPIQ